MTREPLEIGAAPLLHGVIQVRHRVMAVNTGREMSGNRAATECPDLRNGAEEFRIAR